MELLLDDVPGYSQKDPGQSAGQFLVSVLEGLCVFTGYCDML